MRKIILMASAIVSIITIVILLTYSKDDNKIIRIGYFPNVNHAQAILAIENNSFNEALKDEGYKVEYKVFNAGTEAIQSLISRRIDVAYVGPIPTIIGYVRSDGMIKIIAGSASGGSLFIIRDDLPIETPSDLANTRLAAPDYGNTQDISLRSYIIENGLKPKELGGNVEILYVRGSEALILLSKKDIDGAWVAEPWATILLKNTNSRIFLDERDLWPDRRFASALLVVRDDLIENKNVIKKILDVHINTTRWLNAHKDDAIPIIQRHIEDVAKQKLSEDIIKESLSRIEFTSDPILNSIEEFAERAYKLHIFNNIPDITEIYYQVFDTIKVNDGG
ncbi:MAG: sulfate ABC transporter substrate-binding protein [Candidatus Nitrosothermus koennekii]|nr:MAG: sulfate ABC transporter substrate-binding protein [Candidatus Nitrosothermus koennekii]